MGLEAAKINKPFIGPCHAGLIDFAAPITIQNHVIGTVLGGQIISEKMDSHTLSKVANELNIDENTFIQASQDITIVNKRNIEAAAEVLSTVVNALVTNGYNELKLSILSKKLSDNFMHVSTTIEQLSISANSIATQQEKLNEEVVEVRTITSNINKY